MRTYTLLTLTLAAFSFTCVAQNSGVIPICQRDGQWHLLLKNADGTRFWSDFSDEIPAGGNPVETAHRALEAQTEGLYSADSIRMLPQRIIVRGRDVLYFATVSHKPATDRLRWVPIDSILNHTSGCKIEEDLQAALESSWHTVAGKIEASAKPCEEREPASAARAPERPSGEREFTAEKLRMDDDLIRPRSIPTARPTEADEPSPEPSPEPAEPGKPARMSIPDYLAMHAASKYVSYKSAPVRPSASGKKKRCTKHRRKCRRNRRKAAALALYRTRHSKKLCKKACKALIRRRRKCARTMIHKKQCKK